MRTSLYVGLESASVKTLNFLFINILMNKIKQDKRRVHVELDMGKPCR